MDSVTLFNLNKKMDSRAVGIVVVVVVYGVYFRTLYESVPGGDSGELLAEICVSITKSSQRTMLKSDS